MLMFEANRAKQTPGPLRQMDAVVARDAGLAEPLDYDWPSILEMSESREGDGGACAGGGGAGGGRDRAIG